MKYFSMFSGIGGFDLALNRLGHECMGYSEVDENAIKTYQKNFGKEIKNYGDATKISTGDLPDFDILCGGFPCQNFSQAGKRKGFEEARGTLFFDIARVLRDKKPAYFLLENVTGLLTHDKGNSFKVIIQTLSELGYDIQWMVLNSGYYTQQARKRVYIAGILRTHNGGKGFEGFEFVGRLDQGARNTLPTIQTKPIGRGECVFIEAQGKRRWLTVVECERLQGFPDGWTEGVAKTNRYKQCGNAVTVPVVETIAKWLLK